MNSITITQPSHLPPKHAEQLRAIYLASFPPFERAEFSCLLESIAQHSRWLFAAMRDDDLIGMAVSVPRIASDFYLLEYLAVAQAARGEGTGGILLAHVVATLRALGNVNGMILKVESDETGTSDERRLRERRIEFYQRVGARVIECAPYYRVPLADRPGTLRMKLLWLAIGKNVPAPHGAKLCECLQGIFEKSYGLASDSALFQANLEELLC